MRMPRLAPRGEAAGVWPRAVRTWASRYRSEGVAGLADHFSHPHRLHRLSAGNHRREVEAPRRQPWTGRQIAAEGGVSPATVSRIIKRSASTALEPAKPSCRYGASIAAN